MAKPILQTNSIEETMPKWLKVVIALSVLIYQLDILLIEFDYLAREVVKEQLEKQGPGDLLRYFADGVNALKNKQFNLRFMVLGSTFMLMILLFIPDRKKY